MSGRGIGVVAVVLPTLLSAVSCGLVESEVQAAGGTGTGAGGAVAGAGGDSSGGTPSGGVAGELHPDAGTDSSCGLQSYVVTLPKDPVDIVLLVDNSSSMAEELQAIQEHLNPSFALNLQAFAVDFRVILIGEHGHPKLPTPYESSLCIEPPLGGKPCDAVGVDEPPSINPPVFYQYDHDDVESKDGWCKMLDWYDKPDRYNLAPNGWGEWLRPEAKKSFVVVTDDHVSCTWPGGPAYAPCATNGPKCYQDGNSFTYATLAQVAAQQVDEDILALDPEQFGTAESRKYVWHSISGVAKGSSSPDGAYGPAEPLVPFSTTCGTAASSGPGHQALSMLTGGLRFPVCELPVLAEIFETLVRRIVRDTTQCTIPLPDAPPGKQLELSTLTLQYTVGMGKPMPLSQVSDASQCGSSAFYLAAGTDAGASGTLTLCPEACEKVGGDVNVKLEVIAACQ